MWTEEELMLRKELEDLEERSQQCEKMKQQLDQMEDDVLWSNQRSKELNDDLYDSFSKDKKLQQLLLEREELIEQRMFSERTFFQELREDVDGMKKKTNQKMDDCREELERIRVENKDYIKDIS